MDAEAAVQALFTPAGREDPYPYYRALHRLGPVNALQDGLVVVSGYDATSAVLRDPALHVRDRILLDRTYPDWRTHAAAALQAPSLAFDSSPRHRVVRGLLARALSARRINTLQTHISKLSAYLLDRIADAGSGGRTVDLVAEFAHPLASGAIGTLLGISAEDMLWLRPRADLAATFIEPNSAHLDMARADTAAEELTGYLEALTASRRARPGDDLVSSLVQARDENDGRLTETELISNLALLAIAGSETTTHLIGTAATHMMHSGPDLQKLRSRPSYAEPYVEETLRFDGPVQATLRWTAEGTTVSGTAVPPAGEMLVLVGAANRDPNQFLHPDSFDPTRESLRPLSFGAGPHHCAGAALARMETCIELPMLAARFPRMTPAGLPVRRDQLVLRGYDRIPVVLSV
jgi:cytochrome P450